MTSDRLVIFLECVERLHGLAIACQVGLSLTQQVAISIQQQKELADEQAKKVEQLLKIQQAQSKDLSQVHSLVLSQKSTLTSQETSIQSLTNQIQALKETVEGLAKEIPRTTAPNLNTIPFNPVPCPRPPIQTPQLTIDLPSSSPTQGLGRKPSTSPTGEWDGHRQSSFIERLAITPRSARMGWHIHNQLKNVNSSSMTTAPGASSHVDNGIRSRDGFSDLIQGRSSSPFAPSSPTPVALATNLQISYPSPASFKRPFDVMDPDSAQISSATVPSSDLIVQKFAPQHTNLTPSRPSRIFSLPTSQRSAETSFEHQHLEPIRATRLDTFAYGGNSAMKRQPPEPTPGQGQIRKKFKVFYLSHLSYSLSGLTHFVAQPSRGRSCRTRYAVLDATL